MADLIPYDDRDGWIWLNGEMVPWREAKVHVLTHGLHYGSCVFEGERAYGGKVFKLTEHSQRLIDSGRILGFDVPYSAAELDAATNATIARNGLGDCYVRPLAWRGSVLVLALPLATPYCFDYDLVVLAMPIVWLLQSTLKEQAAPADLALLTLAWFSPALFWVIAMAGGPPLMPVVLAALMALVCRHAFGPQFSLKVRRACRSPAPAQYPSRSARRHHGSRAKSTPGCRHSTTPGGDCPFRR